MHECFLQRDPKPSEHKHKDILTHMTHGPVAILPRKYSTIFKSHTATFRFWRGGNAGGIAAAVIYIHTLSTSFFFLKTRSCQGGWDVRFLGGGSCGVTSSVALSYFQFLKRKDSGIKRKQCQGQIRGWWWCFDEGGGVDEVDQFAPHGGTEVVLVSEYCLADCPRRFPVFFFALLYIVCLSAVLWWWKREKEKKPKKKKKPRG